MNNMEQIEKTSGEIFKKSIEDLKKIKSLSDLVKWVRDYSQKFDKLDESGKYTGTDTKEKVVRRSDLFYRMKRVIEMGKWDVKLFERSKNLQDLVKKFTQKEVTDQIRGQISTEALGISCGIRKIVAPMLEELDKYIDESVNRRGIISSMLRHTWKNFGNGNWQKKSDMLKDELEEIDAKTLPLAKRLEKFSQNIKFVKEIKEYGSVVDDILKPDFPNIPIR